MMNWQVSIFFLLLILKQIQSATHVGGVLFENTVWTNTGSANTYYLLKNIQIPKNVTLTIGEGVKVSFALGDFEIFVKGRINISGTSENPVIFQGGSANDKKWMMTFQSTQLSLSSISYAHFMGPKKALQLVDAPDGIVENNGTLIVQSSTFSDNSVVAVNGMHNNWATSSIPRLRFESCTFNKATISSIGLYSEPIIIVNSRISDTTFYPRALYEGIQMDGCNLTDNTFIYDMSNSPNIVRLKNSNVKGMSLLVLIDQYIRYEFYVTKSIVENFFIKNMYYNGGGSLYHTIVSFEQSIITNFSTSFPLSYEYVDYRYYQVLIRNCSFTTGNLNFTYNDSPQFILIEYSQLRNVNIIGKRSERTMDYVRITSRQLTMRYVTFIDGSITFTNGQTDISYSNITLTVPPLALNGSSIITCSSISRSDSIPQQNTTGINARNLRLLRSTVKNFAVGLQIATTSLYNVEISQTNFIDNSAYNLENRGPYNIRVSDIYWGTNNTQTILNKIIDYWDNINYGYVISTNDALSPLLVETSCYATTTPPVETGTYATI